MTHDLTSLFVVLAIFLVYHVRSNSSLGITVKNPSYFMVAGAIIVAGAMIVHHYPRLTVLSGLLIVLYASLRWAARSQSQMTVYFSNNQAEIFRVPLTRQGDGSTNVSAITHQVTMMPLYADVALSQPIGELYSLAHLMEHADYNEVFQTSTFVLNGQGGQGSITVSKVYKNDIHNIFPPDGVYSGPILSGLGDYLGVKGMIHTDIRGDLRKATFAFSS